jgi:hypothetical protein
MIRTINSLLGLGLFCVVAFGADSQTVGEVLDRQFTIADQEITSLIEAMPAANIYDFSSAVLGEKPPVDTGKGDGPDSVRTKDQVVAYVKGAFAYGHKALLSVTEKNQMDRLASGGPRIGSAVWMMWHSLDHYGQMVEYLRMNGTVPPASRQQ